MLTVEGIVIRTIKYGDTSLILDIFSKEKGLISCIVGGVRKRRSSMPSAVFQLLQIMKATIYYKDGDQLSRIKEVQPIAIHHQLIDDPIKRVIVLFLSELIQKSIKEKEARADLYEHIKSRLNLLNNLTSGVANFHLVFMLELSQFLGFSPMRNFGQERKFFDLVDGQFVKQPDVRRTLSEAESLELNKLFAISMEDLQAVSLNSDLRQNILQSLIQYYQLHVAGFGMMKSPKIIHVVLS